MNVKYKRARAMRWFAAGSLAVILAACGSRQPADPPADSTLQASSMKLTSNAFENGQPLPAEFTCDGAGRSPQMQWSEPPAGTESFALVVDDPDAPGGTFGHWGVYDIPMDTRQIDTGAAENAASRLRQAANDFGEPGYGPPCPPKGDKPHRYRFRLMALKVAKLPATPASVEAIPTVAGKNVIGSAELEASYGRK